MGGDAYYYWDTVLKICAGIGALAAFAEGLRQYRRTQRWEHAQFVLSIIEAFHKDGQIELARKMLDWDARRLCSPDGQLRWRFENQQLYDALIVPPVDDDAIFKEHEIVIRDAFDSFFDFFETLFALQRRGLLKSEDYAAFHYYFELIRDADELKGVRGLHDRITHYLDKYKFRGVLELFSQYEKHPDKLYLPRASQGTPPLPSGS